MEDKMKILTIPLLVESNRGHDTIEVPNNPAEIQKAVEGQLNNGNWATIEKTDGSSEILTAKDIPIDEKPLMDMADTPKDDELDDINIDSEEDEEEEVKNTFGVDKGSSPATPSKPTKTANWASKFKAVKSVTAISKAKGG